MDGEWIAIETNLVLNLNCISEKVETDNKINIIELILGLLLANTRSK